MSEAIAQTTLGVGIHDGVPFGDYLAIDAASNSRLKDIDVSPAHCRYRIDNGGDEQTPAMRLGSALHCALLEPKHFEKRFAPQPVVLNPKTGQPWGHTAKAYQSAVGELELDGFSVLKQEEFDLARQWPDLCKSHRGASKLLEATTHRELTAVSSVLDENGRAVLAKARPDFVCAELGILGEVKSTTDLSDAAIARKIGDLDYFRGLAMYQDVLAAAGMELEHLVFLWVNTSPNATPTQRIRTTMLPDIDIELGRSAYQRSLTQYANCLESGEWPGPDDSIVEVGLNPWTRTRTEEELSA